MSLSKTRLEALEKSLFSKKAKADLDTFSKCWHLVLWRFSCDEDKANAWFLSKNDNLGEFSPMQMYQRGRVDKLLKFIKSCLGE